ncbi:hypothetical protein HU200_009718 [Digitaria exilis]|uniref:RNase H type-1 domain-containing protein n=1 Tax=Digitaria exilis TaxID=1010633 RepID=A0A835FKG8_9POAL|nr:hypothetical protein HU200_009718 [Digitaria exilis]
MREGMGRNYGIQKIAVKHVASMVEELLCLSMERLNRSARRKQNWQKPVKEWCKVNTDASFISSSASGAGGAVIRDEEGRLIAAASKRYKHLEDALMAEALAARDGLMLAGVTGCEKVIFEIDNLPLFNLLHSEAGERNVIAGLWQEIRELGKNFSDFIISFV